MGSLWCPVDASREGWWKRWSNMRLDFITRSYPVTQFSTISQFSDPEQESFLSSTRSLSLPSGRNLSSVNAWNCRNNNFGNKCMQSLLPTVKASTNSVAWRCLNIDLAAMAGPLPQPHQFWDRQHLMHSGREAGIKALEHGYEQHTPGKKKALKLRVLPSHTHFCRKR